MSLKFQESRETHVDHPIYQHRHQTLLLLCPVNQLTYTMGEIPLLILTFEYIEFGPKISHKQTNEPVKLYTFDHFNQLSPTVHGIKLTKALVVVVVPSS